MENVRCPYCVEKDGFKPMIRNQIYLVCSSCGHTVIPDQPEYHCICEKCKGMAGEIEIPARW